VDHPRRGDEETALAARKGDEHEQDYLLQLRAREPAIKYGQLGDGTATSSAVPIEVAFQP